jgi:HlyD family secretion protein
MKRNRRWILPLAGVALVVALVLALMPSPLPVTVAEASRGAFAEMIDEEGRTRLRDSYTVSAPIAGFLLRVQPEPGDEVALDQILFRMEPLPAPALDARSLEQAREALSAARARQQNAQATLGTVEADARFAESEYQRHRELNERGLVSAAEMDRVRAARDRQMAARRAAEFAVEVAGFEVDSARAVLDIASGQRPAADQPQLEVRSPVEGMVLRRHRCCEGAIAAGEPVLEVGSLTELEVQVDLLTMMAVRVRPGMRVRLTGWGGDEILQGLVRRVEPAGFTRVSALGVDEQRVPVIIDFLDPQRAAARLGVEFRVEAEFVLWEGEDVLQVPTSALFRQGDGWAVYVVEDGRARLRTVEPGRSSGLVSQIMTGLVAGEIVITHPGSGLGEGARVRVDGPGPSQDAGRAGHGQPE